ncbi:MAG TPA: hypothetical protein VHT34_11405 [Clostridia bacterium]|nr:hypothetical protein [Clostridia bacterium]
MNFITTKSDSKIEECYRHFFRGPTYNGKGCNWGHNTDRWKHIPAQTNCRIAEYTKEIDAGYAIATAIDNDGVLWAWRYSGQTRASATIDAPRKIDDIGEVQSIANGAVLTKDGSLYILNTNYKTVKIGELKNVKAIYRNSFSSIYALDENDGLWVVNVAEIAFSTSKKHQNSITKADFSLNIKGMSKIESRLVLMNNGTVLAFGDNTFGQAGNGDYGFFMIPTKIK